MEWKKAERDCEWNVELCNVAITDSWRYLTILLSEGRTLAKFDDRSIVIRLKMANLPNVGPN